MMVSGNWESLDSNVTLTGGTIGQNPGQGGWLCPAADNPISINTLASTATSVLNVPTRLSGGNTLTFNVASGTTPGGVNLLVANQLSSNEWAYAGITKAGPGLMVFAGQGTFNGTTTVSGGTFQLGDGSANVGYVMGNITNNATLGFANPYAQTYSGTISGSGNVVTSGPGVLCLTGNNSYSGTTIVNGGVLAMSNLYNTNANSVLINAGGALVASGPYSTVAGWLPVINPASAGALALVGTDNETVNMGSYGSLSLGGAAAGATFSGSLAPAGNTYCLGGGGGALTVSTALTGANSLVAFGGGGSGALYLTGANNYTGSTTIDGGMLAMSVAPNSTANSILINAGGAEHERSVYDRRRLAGQRPDQPEFLGALALVGTNNETNNFNSSYSGLWLGAAPGGAAYSGSLTPAGTTYNLGGGGGALTVITALTGNNSLSAFGNGGTGTVILQGASTYTGGTTVGSSGILQFGQIVSMPAAGTVTVSPGADPGGQRGRRGGVQRRFGQRLARQPGLRRRRPGRADQLGRQLLPRGRYEQFGRKLHVCRRRRRRGRPEQARQRHAGAQRQQQLFRPDDRHFRR